MSDHGATEFNERELVALGLALSGKVAAAAMGTLGSVHVWAHMVWRSRVGALAVLPTA